MGKTSNKVIDRYTKKTYQRYVLKVRKDDELNDAIQEFMTSNGNFTGLMKGLLREHFKKL